LWRTGNKTGYNTLSLLPYENRFGDNPCIAISSFSGGDAIDRHLRLEILVFESSNPRKVVKYMIGTIIDVDVQITAECPECMEHVTERMSSYPPELDMECTNCKIYFTVRTEN
jgi:hypothetical protein